jgi:U3 small nucleolar RNA-associated protein 18
MRWLFFCVHIPGRVNDGDDEEDEDQDEMDDGEAPRASKARGAWADEDDEDGTVNIAAQKRLRKLRTTEEETKIDSLEYEKRLRSQ